MPAERARAIIEMSVSGQSNVNRAMEKVVNRTNQLKQQNMGLERSVERHKRVVGELRTNLQGLSAASRRRSNTINQETNALRAQADASRQNIRQTQTDRQAARLIKGARDRRQEQRRLQRELIKERRALDDISAAIARNGRRAKQEGEDRRRIQSKLNDLIVQEKRKLDDVNRSMARNRREIKRQEHETRRLRTEAQMGVNTMSQLSMVSGNVLIGVGGALSAGLYVASRGILQYNTVLNETAAVSGASAAEIRQLDKQARQLGLTTEKSASQAAAGQRELGRAGFWVNEILAATPGVLALSTIGNIEMGRSSEYLAGTISQFGLDATQSNRVVDVFAKSVTSSLFNVEGLGVALGTAGPLAHQFNIPLERTVALLSIVRSAGVGPARTGTGLRSFLAAVANMSQGDVQRLAGIGIEARKLTELLSSGNISGIGRLLENVDPIILTNVFGTEASNVTAIIASQHKQIDAMEKTLLGATGAAQDMRDTMNTGVVGAFREAKSAADGLVLSIGDSGLTGGITVAADVAKTGLRFFDKLPGPFKTLASYLVLAGPLIVGAGIGLRLFALATERATISQIKMNASLAMNNLGLATMRKRATLVAASLGGMALGGITAGVLALGVGYGLLTWHLNNVREAATGAFDTAAASVNKQIDALAAIHRANAGYDDEYARMNKTEHETRVDEIRRQGEENLAKSAEHASERGFFTGIDWGDLWNRAIESVGRTSGGGPFGYASVLATEGESPSRRKIREQGGYVEGPFDQLLADAGFMAQPREIERHQRRMLDDLKAQEDRVQRELDIARQMQGIAGAGADAARSNVEPGGGAIAFQQPFSDDFFGFGEDVGGGRILLQFIVDSSSREGQDLLRIADTVAGGLGE